MNMERHNGSFCAETSQKIPFSSQFVLIDQSFLQFVWKNVENLQVKSNNFWSNMYVEAR